MEKLLFSYTVKCQHVTLFPDLVQSFRAEDLRHYYLKLFSSPLAGGDCLWNIK